MVIVVPDNTVRYLQDFVDVIWLVRRKGITGDRRESGGREQCLEVASGSEGLVLTKRDSVSGRVRDSEGRRRGGGGV